MTVGATGSDEVHQCDTAISSGKLHEDESAQWRERMLELTSEALFHVFCLYYSFIKPTARRTRNALLRSFSLYRMAKHMAIYGLLVLLIIGASFQASGHMYAMLSAHMHQLGAEMAKQATPPAIKMASFRPSQPGL